MKIFLGAGAILDGLLIAATHYMGWEGELYYVWAALAIIWGFLILKMR